MNNTLTTKVKQLDSLLPVQYRTYYHEVANTADGARKECLVFANVAVRATSFLRSSIEHTQFTLENADELVENTVDGHETLKEMLDTMDEHNRSTKALYEALGLWMKEEQARIDIMRTDMEDMVERQSAKGAKGAKFKILAKDARRLDELQTLLHRRAPEAPMGAREKVLGSAGNSDETYEHEL